MSGLAAVAQTIRWRCFSCAGRQVELGNHTLVNTKTQTGRDKTRNTWKGKNTINARDEGEHCQNSPCPAL